MELLKSLSIKNKFHYHKDRTQKVETIKLTMSEEVRYFFSHPLIFASLCQWDLFQKWLSNLLDFFNPPSVYVKHVCFVNFTQWVKKIATSSLPCSSSCSYCPSFAFVNFHPATACFSSFTFVFNVCKLWHRAKENLPRATCNAESASTMTHP